MTEAGDGKGAFVVNVWKKSEYFVLLLGVVEYAHR